MNRTIVFSHEELVCKMAANPDNLDLNLAKAIYDDMVSMVEQEQKLQQELKDKVYVTSFRSIALLVRCTCNGVKFLILFCVYLCRVLFIRSKKPLSCCQMMNDNVVPAIQHASCQRLHVAVLKVSVQEIFVCCLQRW